MSASSHDAQGEGCHAGAGRRGDLDADDQRHADAEEPAREDGPLAEHEAEARERPEVEVAGQVVGVEERTDVPGRRVEVGLVEAINHGGIGQAVAERGERRRQRSAEHRGHAPRRPVPRADRGSRDEDRSVRRPLERLDHRRARIERERRPARPLLAEGQETALPDVGRRRRDDLERADGQGNGLEQRVRREAQRRPAQAAATTSPSRPEGSAVERDRRRAERESGHHEQDGQVHGPDGEDRADHRRREQAGDEGLRVRLGRGAGVRAWQTSTPATPRSLERGAPFRGEGRVVVRELSWHWSSHQG